MLIKLYVPKSRKYMAAIPALALAMLGVAIVALTPEAGARVATSSTPERDSQAPGAFAVSTPITGCGGIYFAPAVSYTVGLHPYSVATRDFNEDGHPDLAVAN